MTDSFFFIYANTYFANIHILTFEITDRTRLG